jgi:hypothetical protein
MGDSARAFHALGAGGVWRRLFERLAADAGNEYAMIDATIVRAHPHSAGARKKGCDQGLGRSQDGLSAKIHATTDARGKPTGFHHRRAERFQRCCIPAKAAELRSAGQPRAAVPTRAGYNNFMTALSSTGPSPPATTKPRATSSPPW